jgi:hypothetical protein
MAETARHLPAIAALEAAIPDAAALVLACLGIALALHGRRALRARALNLASVGTSVFMNAIAAEPGWRNLAIWTLSPVAYALASDTLIAPTAISLSTHPDPDTFVKELAPEDSTPTGYLVDRVLNAQPRQPTTSLASLVHPRDLHAMAGQREISACPGGLRAWAAPSAFVRRS